MTTTNEQLIVAYDRRKDKIKELLAEIEAHEEKQRATEDYLLNHDAQVETIAALYIGRRNDASAAKKLEEAIKDRQEVFETWFAKRLREVGTDAFKTAAGTIYTYRGESVTVGDWDAFLVNEVLGAAAAVLATLTDLTEEQILDALRTEGHFELVNKAVNKTAALEVMGEYDEKKKSRPNPPPAGINYSAVQKIGVRKS